MIRSLSAALALIAFRAGALLHEVPAAAHACALAAIGAAYLLYGLGAYGILNDNEALYAEMAREMLEGGSLGVPLLNGVPYLEKPPLLAWLAAATIALLGESAAAARALPAAAAAALILAMARFGGHDGHSRAGWLTGLILASCFFQLVVFRTLMPESLLALLFGLAMLNFYRWHQEQGGRALMLCYACVGLASLAKGFVAIALAAMVIAAFGATTQRRWGWRALLHPGAVSVLLLLAATWPVYLALRDWDYAWFYVVNEHILRFLGLREPHDYYGGPPYYYLPRIFMFLFPWSAFLPLLLLPRQRETPDAEKLAWCWLLVTLAFFSASSAKANYYMSVAMAPLAFLLARRISERMEASGGRSLAGLSVLLAVAIAGCAAALDSRTWMQPPSGAWIAVFRQSDYLRWVLFGIAALCLLGAALFWRRMFAAALYSIAIAGLPLLVFFVSVRERAEPYASQRETALYIEGNHAGASVFLFRDYEKLGSLPFYLRRVVPVVDSASNDLAFGKKHAPGSPSFVSAEAFDAARSARPVVLVVHRKRLAELRDSPAGAQLRLRHSIGNVSVYSN